MFRQVLALLCAALVSFSAHASVQQELAGFPGFTLENHTIAAGESICSAVEAKAEFCSVAAVRAANSALPNIDRVFPGQEVWLPIPPATARTQTPTTASVTPSRQTSPPSADQQLKNENQQLRQQVEALEQDTLSLGVQLWAALNENDSLKQANDSLQTRHSGNGVSPWIIWILGIVALISVILVIFLILKNGTQTAAPPPPAATPGLSFGGESAYNGEPERPSRPAPALDINAPMDNPPEASGEAEDLPPAALEPGESSAQAPPGAKRFSFIGGPPPKEEGTRRTIIETTPVMESSKIEETTSDPAEAPIEPVPVVDREDMVDEFGRPLPKRALRLPRDQAGPLKRDDPDAPAFIRKMMD